MGIQTHIEWCDSTGNLEVGCDGCELWNGRNVRQCYAGNLVERYAGLKGWPEAFNKPMLFPERLKQIVRWPDLTGTERPRKPWLNGLPRIVFLDDLGDSFSKSLPEDWLTPHLAALAESPHIYVLLSKQAQRMLAFFEKYPIPSNVWPGVSVPSADYLWRVDCLLRIPQASVRVVSAEPLCGPVDFIRFLPCGDATGLCKCGRVHPPHGKPWIDAHGVGWAIVGGQSGQNSQPFRIPLARGIIGQFQAAALPVFVKQLGDWPVIGTQEETRREKDSWPMGTRFGAPADNPELWGPLLRKRKGGDPSEWSRDLRVREMPGRGHWSR